VNGGRGIGKRLNAPMEDTEHDCQMKVNSLVKNKRESFPTSKRRGEGWKIIDRGNAHGVCSHGGKTSLNWVGKTSPEERFKKKGEGRSNKRLWGRRECWIGESPKISRA